MVELKLLRTKLQGLSSGILLKFKQILKKYQRSTHISWQRRMSISAIYSGPWSCVWGGRLLWSCCKGGFWGCTGSLLLHYQIMPSINKKIGKFKKQSYISGKSLKIQNTISRQQLRQKVYPVSQLFNWVLRPHTLWHRSKNQDKINSMDCSCTNDR